MRNLKKKDIDGKICLLRVDFNVEDIKDALRPTASLPTMKFLLKSLIKYFSFQTELRTNWVAHMVENTQQKE